MATVLSVRSAIFQWLRLKTEDTAENVATSTSVTVCALRTRRKWNMEHYAYTFVSRILSVLLEGGIKKVKVKRSHYRPGVAQRVDRGIVLLFHDRGTRRGWVVSSTPWPHFTPGKDPVPILQNAGWAPGPVWTGRKSHPHLDLIPDRPTRSQSLYRLSYLAHEGGIYSLQKHYKFISYWLADCLSRLHSVRSSWNHHILQVIIPFK